MTREINRKQLFREVFGFLRRDRAPRSAGPRDVPSAILRPPGALAQDRAYLEACTGCEQCVDACPHNAISMVEATGRRIAAVSPLAGPCRLCDDLPCIGSCPDGALRPLSSRSEVRMGVAQVDPRLCRTFKGEVCDDCVTVCPLSGSAIRMIGGRPVVMPHSCVGCGMCESVCPDRPRSIRVHPERELVPGVRIPRLDRTPAG